MANLKLKIQAFTSAAGAKLDSFTARTKSGFKGLNKSIRSSFASMMAFSGTVYMLNRLSDASRALARKMMEINTIARESSGGLVKLKQTVLEVSKAFGEKAVVAATAMYDALSAGIEKSRIKEFLTVAAKAAIAGATTISTAVDGLTSVIKGYGLTADNARRISDIVFETIRKGKTVFTDLAQHLGKTIPLAVKAGYAFEQIAAAMATMTKSGIATDKAAVAVRGILQELIAPNEKLSIALKQVAAMYGVASYHQLTFQQVLKGIGEVTNQSAAAIQGMFPNVRALNGALVLMGDGAKEAAEDLKDITNSAGAAQKAFNEFANSDDQALKKKEQRLADIARRFGEIVTSSKNALMGIGDYVTRSIAVMNQLPRVFDDNYTSRLKSAWTGKKHDGQLQSEAFQRRRQVDFDISKLWYTLKDTKDPAARRDIIKQIIAKRRERAEAERLLEVFVNRGPQAYRQAVTASEKRDTAQREAAAEKQRQQKMIDQKKLNAENARNQNKKGLSAFERKYDDKLKAAQAKASGRSRQQAMAEAVKEAETAAGALSPEDKQQLAAAAVKKAEAARSVPLTEPEKAEAINKAQAIKNAPLTEAEKAEAIRKAEAAKSVPLTAAEKQEIIKKALDQLGNQEVITDADRARIADKAGKLYDLTHKDDRLRYTPTIATSAVLRIGGTIGGKANPQNQAINDIKASVEGIAMRVEAIETKTEYGGGRPRSA